MNGKKDKMEAPGAQQEQPGSIKFRCPNSLVASLENVSRMYLENLQGSFAELVGGGSFAFIVGWTQSSIVTFIIHPPGLKPESTREPSHLPRRHSWTMYVCMYVGPMGFKFTSVTQPNVVEEEIYRLFWKCRLTRQPCHLLGLGFSILVALWILLTPVCVWSCLLWQNIFTIGA